MRRLWLGAALLVILLCLGLWITVSMDRVHEPISALLDRASQAALEGDWEAADAASQQARETWERHWNLTAAVADHSPMDDIDGLFAQLPIFVQERETADFAAACAQLSKLTHSMGSSHSPTWWNLL